MTYILEHANEAHWLTKLLDTLEQDMSDLRQMVSVCGDALEMPGRRPDNDPERTGRQATHGPSRPTEDIALDEARALMRAQLKIGVTYVSHAVACVRGTTAGMDRALAVWEGEPLGGGDACTDGAAEFDG